MYEIGKYWIEKDHIDKINILLDSNDLKKYSKSVIFIDLVKDESIVKYDKVSLESFDEENVFRYFYKKGSSRGTNISPTSLITEVEKTFETKFIKWFENYQKEDKLIDNIYSSIKDNDESILSEIDRIYSSIESENKRNVILTIRFLVNDDYSYINEYDIFKNILFDKAIEKYYKLGSKKSKGKSCCYLCNEYKEVYGLVPSAIKLTFGTGDKPGNVPEFYVQNQWKQSSICPDCALTLEAGKKYVDKYLKFSEYRLNYYIIPNIFFNQHDVFDQLDVGFREYESKRHVEDLTSEEDDLKELVEDLEDYLEFKYLYFEASNNSFNILGYVESVLPSWLRKLYDQQNNIKKLQIFNESSLKDNLSEKVVCDNFIDYLSKNSKNSFNTSNWYLSLLRDFFPYDTANKYYLELVMNIMGQKQINYDFLLSKLMNTIRTNWRNYDTQNFILKINVYKSLMLLLLFEKLKLFKGDSRMSIENMNTDDILNLINSPDKKACFLLGVLTKKLTNIQYKEIGSTPFIKKLWELNLTYERIQKVYTLIINKLREYDGAYPLIEEEITLNLLKSENNWNLNKDEISYYFVLGFTIGNKVQLKKEDDVNE